MNGKPRGPGGPVAAAAGACLALCGCAADVVHQQETTNATGIRYYMNAPYLIVYSDGKGGLQWQIRYLPDQSRIMTATPHIVGARLEMTMTFQNGVLSNSSTLGDTSAVPKAVIAAVQNVLPLLAKGLGAAPTAKGFPAPSLYKIVVKGDEISFIGTQPTIAIQTPINTGPLPDDVTAAK